MGVTDTVTVYADKEDPTDQAYFSFFLDTNENRPTIIASMTDTVDTGEYNAEAEDEGRLNFTATDITAKERKLLCCDGDWVLPDWRQTALGKFEDDMDTNSVDESMPSFDGTFHGIPW